MTEVKKAHAIYWGLGGTTIAVGCTVGALFTGPVGWVVLGTCSGFGSGVAVSSVQQSWDKD